MNELAKKWVDALRNGNYSQTKWTLRDEFGYCCLGVAWELIHGKDAWGELAQSTDPSHPEMAYDSYEYGKTNGNLNMEDYHLLGFSGDISFYGSTLIDANDSGKSLAEIADMIEAMLEGGGIVEND